MLSPSKKLSGTRKVDTNYSFGKDQRIYPGILMARKVFDHASTLTSHEFKFGSMKGGYKPQPQ